MFFLFVFFFSHLLFFLLGKEEKNVSCFKGRGSTLGICHVGAGALMGMSGIPVPSCRDGYLQRFAGWGSALPATPPFPRAALGDAPLALTPLELLVLGDRDRTELWTGQSSGQGTGQSSSPFAAGQSLLLWRTCPAGLFFIPGLFSAAQPNKVKWLRCFPAPWDSVGRRCPSIPLSCYPTVPTHPSQNLRCTCGSLLCWYHSGF